MSQDLETTQQPSHQVAPMPFQSGRGLAASVNAGAVSIESDRAIAEAQGQLTLAKRFPRDLLAAQAELMIACKHISFASVAFYSKPQGGGKVTGPSIRLAEEIARVVGNFQYGHRELSRDGKKSEVEVFAWDMEKNNYNKRQKTVMHVRDTREGPKPLRDQTDIDQRINNVASKEMRGLILGMMPKWLVEDAVAECRKTLAGDNTESIHQRLRKMTNAFATYGVSVEMLEKHLGHKLDATTADEIVDLTGTFNALRDGAPASELFADKEADSEVKTDAAKAVSETAKSAAAAKASQTLKPKATEKTAPAAKVAGEENTTKPVENASQTDSNPVEKTTPDHKNVTTDDGGDVF